MTGVSEENVEALRHLFELVGDGENPEVLYELLDPDVEFVLTDADLNAGPHRGHDGVRRYFRSWAGTWSEWHFRPERLVAVGDNQVAVDLHQRGRGRASGVEVKSRLGQLWTFRDGLVVRWENFRTFEEALSAARRG
jgi:ketosteroid isomerase-like protein